MIENIYDDHVVLSRSATQEEPRIAVHDPNAWPLVAQPVREVGAREPRRCGIQLDHVDRQIRPTASQRDR